WFSRRALNGARLHFFRQSFINIDVKLLEFIVDEVIQIMESTSKKMKVRLSGAQETLLITLYAKAMDNRSKNPILHDTKADEMVRLIDYDFSKMNSFGNDNLIVVRAKQYDDWIQEFLARNPNCVVLNLGCGLDTRVTRINPPSTVNWFDVDFPEVIQMRKNFY